MRRGYWIIAVIRDVMGGEEEEDRAVDGKLCDTLTDVRLCPSQRGERKKRPLNKKAR